MKSLRQHLRTICKTLGLSLIILGTSWSLFILLEVKEDSSQSARTIRVFWGAAAYLAMAINLLLASRLSFVETIFGGLDKAYKQHRQLGILTMLSAIIHYWSPPIFADENCTGVCADLLWPSILAGQIALILLLVFGLISTLRRYSFKGRQLPYGVWKMTHWIMLIVFSAATFHLMQMPKMSFDYRNFAQILGLIGIICALIYGGAHLRRRRRTYDYEVISITRQGDVTLIDAQAVGRRLNHRAGQFAFLKFDAPGLKEAHPFSISSSEDDTHIQFCIKAVGDFTKQLPQQIKVGSKAIIEGPYGRFASRAHPTQTWVAAGIGITPFLSLVKSMNSSKPQANSKTSLTYIYRNDADAIQPDILEAAMKNHPEFEFIAHATANSGRWAAPDDITGVTLFCGPKPLKRDLQKKAQDLKTEDFEFN